jgi:hypothetical protein
LCTRLHVTLEIGRAIRYMAHMRRTKVWAAVVVASLASAASFSCGGSAQAPAADAAQDDSSPRSYAFGPYTLTPGEEITNDCVQITLHNDAPLYINQVHLTTGAGFHHSNWFYVPEDKFIGSDGADTDGTFDCSSRNFDEAAAAIFGGVLFAQSTQDPDEIQQFPDGDVVTIPAHSKLFAQIHLLDVTDGNLSLSPTIALTPLPLAQVKTRLAGLSFEDMALALPPGQQSRFTIDCDLGSASQIVSGGPPSFHIYYALAHYHALGTGLTFEAVTAAGSATTIYTTATHIGDTLGGELAPPFDFTGYTRLRVSCDYYNDTADVVNWGNGSAEMCVFLAFTDSKWDWGGGVTSPDAPGPMTLDGNVETYSHACSVYATEANE